MPDEIRLVSAQASHRGGPIARACCLVAALWACAGAGLAAADDSRTAAPRVRPTQQRLAQALDDGIARSATIRDLVNRLEESDVIVHIRPLFPVRGSTQGEMHFATATAGTRYIAINVQEDLPWAQLIAMIAHELQHALEVAEAPEVIDDESLRTLYESIGHSRGHGRHETLKARDVGAQVLREIVDSQRASEPPTAKK